MVKERDKIKHKPETMTKKYFIFPANLITLKIHLFFLNLILTTQGLVLDPPVLFKYL